MLIAILLWEGVKLLGTVVTLPFETSNQAMPHVWTIAEGALAPEVRGSDTPVWVTVLRAAIYTLLIAFGGFIIGVAVGLLLAIVMQRFAFFERGLLPSSSPRRRCRSLPWRRSSWASATASVSALPMGANPIDHVHRGVPRVLPLSVGALRGLQAATPTQLELMRSYAATPRATLWKLRFPASVPYLVRRSRCPRLLPSSAPSSPDLHR